MYELENVIVEQADSLITKRIDWLFQYDKDCGKESIECNEANLLDETIEVLKEAFETFGHYLGDVNNPAQAEDELELAKRMNKIILRAKR